MNKNHTTIADTAPGTGRSPDQLARTYPGKFRETFTGLLSGVRGAGEYCRLAGLDQESPWSTSDRRIIPDMENPRGMRPVTMS